MQPTIVPLDATLGAKVTDIDLKALDDATWQIIENAFFDMRCYSSPANISMRKHRMRSGAVLARS